MKTFRTTVLCLKCCVNKIFKVIKVELKRKVWGGGQRIKRGYVHLIRLGQVIITVHECEAGSS